jgi:L-aminoacid ligase-like protein
MMLPIRYEGMLRAVHGLDSARAVPGIVGLELAVHPGRVVRPLPEGDRYLGFLFARGESPSQVEQALRTAYACLSMVIEPCASS